MELGYERSPVNLTNYQDGMIRTFGDVPEFDPRELDMIYDWVGKGDIESVFLYLQTPKYGYDLSDELCGFVVREVCRGNYRRPTEKTRKPSRKKVERVR